MTDFDSIIISDSSQISATQSNSNMSIIDHKKERQELIKSFVEYAKSRGINSTVMGLTNIIRTKFLIVRLMWIIIWLGSIAFCLFLVIDSIISYFQYNLGISIKYKTDSNAYFPAITVCNLNIYKYETSNDYIKSLLDKNNLSYLNDIRTTSLNPKLISNFINSNIAGDKKLSDLDRQSLGYTIDFMLLKCFINDVPCNASDFVWRYDYNYLNCYTFNSGYDRYGNKREIIKLSESGSDRSFRLELFIGSDSFNSTRFTLNSGARVVIHNQSIVPIISSEGTDITTGFQTNIAIKKSFFNKLDAPYSDCVKQTRSKYGYDSDFYRAVFEILNMTTYRQIICNKLCLQEYILEKCGCLDASLPNIYVNRSLSVCMSIDLLQCVSNKRIGYYEEEAGECATRCPLECTSIEYTLSLSNSRYPTSYYIDYMKKHTDLLLKFNKPSDDNIQKTTLGLNVYYEDLDFVETSEIPDVKLDELVSNIGGTLGLFIGLSLLSIVEFVEFLMQIARYTFYYLRFFSKKSDPSAN